MNESVLESVYFQPKFRVRCAIKYTNKAQEILTVKSSHIQVMTSSEDSASFEHSAKCMQLWQEKAASDSDLVDSTATSLDDRSISFFYSKETSGGVGFGSSATLGGQNHLFASALPLSYLKLKRPFVARADYVSAEFITNNPSLVDADFLNYIRISVDIPYIEGFVPIISTQPLHNYRYLLNGPSEDTSDQHVCSSFMNAKRPIMPVKYGFLRAKTGELLENIDLEAGYSKYRNGKTLDFYSSLDRTKCMWQFVAYYDIGELTTHCQAQISSNSDEDSSLVDTQDQSKRRFESRVKSYLTIRVPLYVSYLYADGQAAWLSIDYKTSVEASIIYKTKSFQVNNENSESTMMMMQDDMQSQLDYILSASLNSNHPNNQNLPIVEGKADQNLASLSVTKIGLIENGKLSIEFTTVPAFYGQFIKQHASMPNAKSMVVPPPMNGKNGAELFTLELVWSQYTYDYPEQTWRATSTSVLNVIFQNTTLILVASFLINSVYLVLNRTSPETTRSF